MFSKLGHELFWEMAHWLGRKYKINMPAILRRHSKGTRSEPNSIKTSMPNKYKAKRFITKTWHNPYTAKR